MSRKGKFIYTDIDLDGAMSYLLMVWFNNNKHIPYISSKVTDFNKSFAKWLSYHKPSKYSNIYILDLDISQDSISMVDLDNVVIIDHHTTHVNNKHKYTKAKHFIKEETSCCKHIYNLLHKQSDVQLTDQQKHLLLLVDDYDCYKLQLPGSHELNLLFWNYQGDRVAKFITEFGGGFHGFTDDQTSIIKFYKKAIQETISNLDIFTATIPIGDNTYNIVSTFASKHINDVAHHIINDNGADVGIVVNLESKKVSFRKDKAVDIDLSKLANKLASGGGHKYAAGGLLTETFMSFSKLFKPLS